MLSLHHALDPPYAHSPWGLRFLEPQENPEIGQNTKRSHRITASQEGVRLEHNGPCHSQDLELPSWVLTCPEGPICPGRPGGPWSPGLPGAPRSPLGPSRPCGGHSQHQDPETPGSAGHCRVGIWGQITEESSTHLSPRGARISPLSLRKTRALYTGPSSGAKADSK